MNSPLSIFKKSAFLLATLCALNSSSWGYTLLTNLNGNDGASGQVTNTQYRGVTFTSLAAQDVLTVTVRLGGFQSGDMDSLSIHADNGGAPGTRVGQNFTAPASASDAVSNFTFTPNGTVSLSASTTYWLITKGNSGKTFDWYRNAGDGGAITPTTTDYASFGAEKISTDSGSNWTTGSSGAHSFAITAVPEPSTYLAAGLITSIFGLSWVRTRLRKSKTSTVA